MPEVVELKSLEEWERLYTRYRNSGVVIKVHRPNCPHCVRLAPRFAELARKDTASGIRYASIQTQAARPWIAKYKIRGVPSVFAFGKRGSHPDFVHPLRHGSEQTLATDIRRFAAVERGLPAWTGNAWFRMFDNSTVKALLTQRFSKLNSVWVLHQGIGNGAFFRHRFENHAFRTNFVPTRQATDPHTSSDEKRDELFRQYGRTFVQSTTGQLKYKRRKNRTWAWWLYRRMRAGKAGSFEQLFAKT